MKNTILTLSILSVLITGISCKKSTNTTTTNKTSPPTTASTQTVNIQIQYSYGRSVAENLLWYKVNNGQQVTLSTGTAITYTSNTNVTIGQVSVTANVGDVFVMGGAALNVSPYDKFTFDQTNITSTQMITNGVVTGTVSDYGHDMEYTTTSGTTTFSFTAH